MFHSVSRLFLRWMGAWSTVRWPTVLWPNVLESQFMYGGTKSLRVYFWSMER